MATTVGCSLTQLRSGSLAPRGTSGERVGERGFYFANHWPPLPGPLLLRGGEGVESSAKPNRGKLHPRPFGAGILACHFSAGLQRYAPFGCAVSSVVEHHLDTVGVRGSKPLPRTIPPKNQASFSTESMLLNWGARPPRAQRVAPSRLARADENQTPFRWPSCVRVRREGAPNYSRGGCAPHFRRNGSS